ncbi:MAG: glutathione synthase [Beggiatoa sp. IS2]|nr:MAG: glutathione synthase [Beggiatoa sp. IS2]
MIHLGIIMDPIDKIKVDKDSSLAMLLAAQARDWTLWYMEISSLWLLEGQVYAKMRQLKVFDNTRKWFKLSPQKTKPLSHLNVILMRKDPPFDFEYLVTTHLLEIAEAAGVLVVNKPQSLRDVNEKLYISWFPQCCVSTMVTRQIRQLRSFLHEQREIILKPLDNMGGASVFRVALGDPNTSVIFEMMTNYQQRFVMAQTYIPEITAGDKRILLIDGEPIPYVLARIPHPGETRGNLAAGGHGQGQELSERDRWICSQVGATLREKGLLFVGLDVIGNYLTEINVTSPTCIRELDREYGLDIAGQLLTAITQKLKI